MSELILVDYHDALRAEQALAALKDQRPEWSSELADALVFVVHPGGKPLSPAWWRQRVGVTDEDFLRRAGKLLRPGDSALLLHIKALDPDVVIDEVQRYGGRWLHTAFSARQDARFPLASASEAWA
ncbi:MAG TPA: DUF1269 domain-containing protein [Ktedonobacterales bacterium]|jgi:uncharacterized membrane protein